MPKLGAPTPRQTVLVTGATGVVGHALLARLRAMDIVCLVHKAPVHRPGVASISGDLTQARFGLPGHEYDRLADRVDAVIHCAAVTDFNRTDGSLEATNIGGTEEVIAFARASGARLYHVSTAYLHAEASNGRGETAVRYAASKRAGEALIRDSGVPHVIHRPSVVIGDSRTGEVKAFQGLYLVVGAILGGMVPLIPFDAAWPIDFVPCDVVADAIAMTVEQQLTSGEFWLTAGTSALTLGAATDLCLAFGEQIGVTVDRPRFVPPEVFDRLIGPVFLEFLPRKVRYTVVRLLEFFTAYLSMDAPLPSSLAHLAGTGAMDLPDQRSSFLSSLGFWAAATGRGAKAPEAEVA